MYQELENKALSEFRKAILSESSTPEIERNSISDNLSYFQQEFIENFWKSHLQLAYQSGVDKTIERFATGDFIRGEEAEKFLQQAIAGERERIGKEFKKWFNDGENDELNSYEVIEDAIERITGIKC